MAPRSRTALLVLILWLPVVAATVGPAVAGAGAAPAPVEDPAKGLRFTGLQRAADGPCKGKFEIKAAAGRGGPARCTHGPDPAPPGIDVRVAREPESPATTAAVRPEAAARAEGTMCSGDGTSGTRVQLVYANITGQPDRYAAFASSFQLWAATMDGVFNLSAGETGGGRRVKFVHDAGCQPVISRSTLSTAAAADFTVTTEELWENGFNRNDRKYMVWVDANVYCGIGEVFNDDRASQNNYNNVFGLFARVDNGCWGIPGQSVEAHEVMHTLGGVQETAPHGTAYNHCTDEQDRMCYWDGSGEPLTHVCPAAHESLFDCNHDDYFSTAPTAGSYLAGHWNVATSAWLAPVAPPTVPSAPSDVFAVVNQTVATVSWSPPASDGGLLLTGYVVTPYDGATAKLPRTFSSTATTQTITGLTGLTAGSAWTFKVAARNALGTGPQSEASGGTTPVDGARFNPLPPSRLLDTRAGNGAPLARVGSGASLDLQVTGRGGVPATDVSAVVLNVTVTEPVSGGYLTAWPTGEAQPLASNLNFVPGQTVPNLVVVKVGANGRVSLFNGGGSAHLIADVAGWYGPTGADAGSRYHPLTPARLLDTRSGTGAPVARVAAGASLNLQVTGRGGVPASNVSAVVLNVTVTEPLAAGFLTAWPTGELLPLASNLNFLVGQTVPNLVVAKVGTDGKVSLYNGGGSVHMVADVAGWFGPDGEAAGSPYIALAPARILDTRAANGAPQAPLLAGGTLDLQVTGRGGVPATGVSAVILNVTIVDPVGGGFLTAWPAGQARPLASNLNFIAGWTVPNLVVAKVGTGGRISFYNGGGHTHLVADVAGWYAS